MTDDNKNQPMDIGAPEGDAPDMYKPLDRMPYAMEQLVGEVTDLFPDTTYELSNRNQRGVCFDIQFPQSSDPSEVHEFTLLMVGLKPDSRIQDVVADTEGILVSFRNDPRIMDLRDPFGLAAVWAMMHGQDEGVFFIPESLSFPGGFDAKFDGPNLDGLTL